MSCISTKTKGWKWPEKKNQLLFPIKAISALQYFRKCVFWLKKRVFCLLVLDVKKENIYVES